VVVGYTVENDEVTSLVLARIEGDEVRYAGTVRPTLTAEQKDDLLKRFGRLASARPIFPNFETPVVWLKPELACEVEHAGGARGPLLKEPRFKGLVEPAKPGAAPGKKPEGTAPEVPPGRP
jgi:ATP-dependent DNA ligase